MHCILSHVSMFIPKRNILPYWKGIVEPLNESKSVNTTTRLGTVGNGAFEFWPRQ